MVLPSPTWARKDLGSNADLRLVAITGRPGTPHPIRRLGRLACLWRGGINRRGRPCALYIYCSAFSSTPRRSPLVQCCAEKAAEARSGDVAVRKQATCASPAGTTRAGTALVADICVPQPGTVTRPG